MELSDILALIGGQLVAVAVTTEATVQVLKKRMTLTPEQDQLAALVVSLAGAVGTFCFLLPPFSSMAANITTAVVGGAVASRGASFVHDVLNIIRGHAALMKLKGSVADEMKAEKAQ